MGASYLNGKSARYVRHQRRKFVPEIFVRECKKWSVVGGQWFVAGASACVLGGDQPTRADLFPHLRGHASLMGFGKTLPVNIITAISIFIDLNLFYLI
jgi:hypothetical protein